MESRLNPTPGGTITANLSCFSPMVMWAVVFPVAEILMQNGGGDSAGISPPALGCRGFTVRLDIGGWLGQDTCCSLVARFWRSILSPGLTVAKIAV